MDSHEREVPERSIDHNPELRELLERAVVHHGSSAAILRAGGREREAARLERFASRARLRLVEPRTTRQMHLFALRVCDAPRLTMRIERALEGAISLAGADFGNVQIRDRASGELRIVCQYGFSCEFLEYFAAVDDESSACGRAARRRAQTVIADVDRDPGFAPHREIAAASSFRAVRSTPLVDPLGCLLGVLSIHFRRPQRPAERELQIMEWYAELVGAALAAGNGTGAPEVYPPESPVSEPVLAGASGLDHSGARYCYTEDARRHAANARIAEAESQRLNQDAVTAHTRAAVLHDHAVELYGRLAENARVRGNAGSTDTSESLAALYRRRAHAARRRAGQARHAARIHEDLHQPDQQSATTLAADRCAAAATAE